jgi:hypothetical protein
MKINKWFCPLFIYVNIYISIYLYYIYIILIAQWINVVFEHIVEVTHISVRLQMILIHEVIMHVQHAQMFAECITTQNTMNKLLLFRLSMLWFCQHSALALCQACRRTSPWSLCASPPAVSETKASHCYASTVHLGNSWKGSGFVTLCTIIELLNIVERLLILTNSDGSVVGTLLSTGPLGDGMAA